MTDVRGLLRRFGYTAAALLLPWAGAVTGDGTATVDGVAQAGSARPSVHWARVATENFNGPLATGRWTRYDGRPECCTETLWRPKQVRVSHGVLNLRNNPNANGTWISGGIGGWSWGPANRRYGRWDARLRMDVGGGISGTALLWPNHGWPPEVNYFEVFETWSQRDRMAVTTHYTKNQAPNQSQWIVHDDFTRWHVVSVRWTPAKLVYVVDGDRVLVEHHQKRIPQTAMWPAFQTHVHRLSNGRFPKLIPGQRSVKMQVDWVRVFGPAGGPAG
jgi:beta-glucanase (GH16 family)